MGFRLAKIFAVQLLDDWFNVSDTIPVCDEQTDRQTERQTELLYRALHSCVIGILACEKNTCSHFINAYKPSNVYHRFRVRVPRRSGSCLLHFQ